MSNPEKVDRSVLSISLHPLVIINISDHHTRQKVNSEGEPRVFGALLGVQKGRQVEIFNSFAFLLQDEQVDGKTKRLIDEQYFQEKIQQCIDVYYVSYS